MKKFYNKITEDIIDEFFAKEKKIKQEEKRRTHLKKNRYRKKVLNKTGK